MQISRLSPKNESINRGDQSFGSGLTPLPRCGRVCSKSCTVACSKCGKADCNCMCDQSCTSIAATLSSDPKYPIEAKITPFVFEMRRLETFTPCWSCEGHSDNQGEIWKTPQVWFYCSSDIHLRLLYDGLSTLFYSGALNAQWAIQVTFSDASNPDTTYAVEPKLDPEKNFSLDQLQADAAIIAENFSSMLDDSAMRISKGI